MTVHPVRAVLSVDAFRTLAAAVCSAILLFRVPAVAAAADPPVPFRSRCVDLVLLADGTRLLGSVLDEDERTVLLRRTWLQTDAPEFFAADVQPRLQREDAAATPALSKMIEDELARLRKATPGDLRRIGMLQETAERLATAERSASPWVILRLPDDCVRRIVTQSAQIRPVGFYAILNGVPDAEQRGWQDVSDELKRIPLGDRVTALPQTDSSAVAQDQLADLLAAIDVRTANAGRLIRTGDVVVSETDELPVAALLPQLLTSEFGKQLAPLLQGRFPDDPLPGTAGDPPSALNALPPAAVELAERQGWNSVVISAFDVRIAAGTAGVSRAVFTHSDERGWRPVLQVRGTADRSDVSEQSLQELSSDPRVEQVLQVFTGLGAESDELRQALSLGAVVRVAAGRCEDQFQSQLSDLLSGRRAGEPQPAPPVVDLTEPLAPPR